METKGSPFSLLISFYRRLDLPGDVLGVDSRQKFRDYAVREINFLLWLALISFTAFLLKKLVLMFDLRLKGDRSPSSSFSGHCKLFAWDNHREEELIAKHQ